MLESQQQIKNLLNSQSFPNQTPYTPFLEHPIEEKSELEKRLEVYREMAQQIQNMLDSSSQPNFQESCSFFPVAPIQNDNHQSWTCVWNPCVSSSGNHNI